MNACIEAAPSHKVAIEAYLVTIVVRTEAATAHIVGAIEYASFRACYDSS